MKQELIISALLEEYRAMYELAVFRMTALDRRAPVTAGLFGIAIASLHSLPIPSQLLVLLATPPALVWLMRTTVNHARSFEDVLRRIEVIESTLNERLGDQLLTLQSIHPSRGKHVGGRTGHESTLAVLATSLLLLIGAGYQAWQGHVVANRYLPLYLALLGLVATLVVSEFLKLRTYRYLPLSPPAHSGPNSDP